MPTRGRLYFSRLRHVFDGRVKACHPCHPPRETRLAIPHSSHEPQPSASSLTLNSSFQRPLLFVLTHHNSSTPSSVIREWKRTGT